MKVLISGGHLTPALALIDYIQLRHPSDEIIFVGRIYSQHKFKQLAQEKKEIEAKNVKFIPLEAIKISQTNSIGDYLISPLLFMRSLTQAVKIMKAKKPDIFVSFGGFLAVPLALAAKLTHVPILAHEQTRAAGFANQIMAFLANQVAISHLSSIKFFPTTRTTLTGNLIRAKLTQKISPRPKWITNSKIKKPILLIMGGNQGSYAINQAIKQALSELTKNWTLIHLCGNSSVKFNYLKELQKAKAKLPLAQQQNYYIKKWANDLELAWIYNHTQVSISRAGANSVMELTYKKIPTIFIPLTHSHHHEQYKNAQTLVKKQAGLLLPQSKLNSHSLLNELKKISKERQKIIKQLEQIKIPLDAAAKLYQLMTRFSIHAP